jgi:hypothetical protein
MPDVGSCEPRRAKGRHGYFIAFLRAMSNDAAKGIRTEIKRWRLHLRSDLSLDDLADWVNPNPSRVRVSRHRSQHEVPSNAVEERFQIEVDRPVELPAASCGNSAMAGPIKRRPRWNCSANVTRCPTGGSAARLGSDGPDGHDAQRLTHRRSRSTMATLSFSISWTSSFSRRWLSNSPGPYLSMVRLMLPSPTTPILHLHVDFRTQEVEQRDDLSERLRVVGRVEEPVELSWRCS